MTITLTHQAFYYVVGSPGGSLNAAKRIGLKPPDSQHPTARRLRPNRSHPTPLLPSRHNPAARCLLRTVATATNLELYRLAVFPAPPGAIPVALCYCFLAF
ncbi:hypothetical protein DEO72_LG3g1923 [Vigna unguiculata]|uniref:Uncharacterized protein n=1 Tax=Vigna unguiculata TaxID=3917 RepID=A0A4D6LFF7_VIGUN|nr:hypothetical protein DEO72_LG3g1923 [Vigna unguiculata]